MRNGCRRFCSWLQRQLELFLSNDNGNELSSRNENDDGDDYDDDYGDDNDDEDDEDYDDDYEDDDDYDDDYEGDDDDYEDDYDHDYDDDQLEDNDIVYIDYIARIHSANFLLHILASLF